MPRDYDMLVIGGGAAGLTASGMSALLGAKTALVEEHRLGGDCTWTGCIPSKTLLKRAKIAHQIGTGGKAGEPFIEVMRHVRSVRQHVYEQADAPPNLERFGVEVIASRARFIDPHTVEISESANTRRITSRYFVIATGSRPRMPAFETPCLNNETIFELNEQPGRLLVVGAGPVGIEMAQAFQRLGSQVTVVGSGSRILPRDDEELAAQLEKSLASEGCRFLLTRKVTALARSSSGLRARLDDGTEIECDAALAAMGREPSVHSLDLEKAGVSAGTKGIEVDRRCRTSQKHIYAVGDVTGRYQFTHMAEHMSKVAVTNAILRIPSKLQDNHVAWCTFTSPELAHTGESEKELLGRNIAYEVFRFPFTRLDRAIAEGEEAGMVKIFATRQGHILGASILGANAGEMIAVCALAMKNNLRLADIADTIFPYPTYTLGVRQAADQWYLKKLDSPLLALLGRIFGYRGSRKKPSFS
jgi:pyruvate/2-oxoglutarate dehydrogenase complex dihydrolipoamide dehydrogenase (E3) component